MAAAGGMTAPPSWTRINLLMSRSGLQPFTTRSWKITSRPTGSGSVQKLLLYKPQLTPSRPLPTRLGALYAAQRSWCPLSNPKAAS